MDRAELTVDNPITNLMMMTAWEQVVTAGAADPPTAESEEPIDEAPRVAHIGPLPNARQAREWALVLQSQSIAYAMFAAPAGWVLQIAPDDLERALDSIDLYERENENWPPVVVRDTPRHEATPIIALLFFSALLFLLYVTGPAAAGSAWFVRGRADAALLASEPWRMITALTLHADAKHALGNAISGSIFGTMVARRIGPGGALLAIVAAGALGNAGNALYHLADGHRSIGASTAVFAAVGILAAVQTVLLIARLGSPERRAQRPRNRVVDLLAPLIGGLALLGSLGSGADTDVTAHGFGFAAGVVIGGVAGYLVRPHGAPPSRWWQIAAGTAGMALVLGAWLLATLA